MEPPPTSAVSVVPISLTATPSAAARSRSMVTSACGCEKDSEFCTTMKRPLACARFLISSAIS